MTDHLGARYQTVEELTAAAEEENEPPEIRRRPAPARGSARARRRPDALGPEWLKHEGVAAGDGEGYIHIGTMARKVKVPALGGPLPASLLEEVERGVLRAIGVSVD